MPEMRSPESAAAKWARRAGSAGPEYEDGVKNPRKDWAQATADAEEAFKAGVTAAAAAGRFGTGVRKAGTAKWQDNAIAKGPLRYAQGVALAEGAYASGFSPYADVIRNTKLPKRGPKGAPGNIERVKVMAAALHQKRISLQGGR